MFIGIIYMYSDIIA